MNRLTWTLLWSSISVKHAFSFTTGRAAFWQRGTQLQESNELESEHNPMSKTSRFSHVMLKVPSVDKTVKYWTDKGGKVRMSRAKANGVRDELQSAFVELGCQGGESKESFALELVATQLSNYRLGNCIEYVGVSMLLQFQNNLLAPIVGQKPQNQGMEPNAIPVRSSASAPGDFIARFALKSNDLVSTHNFYATLLGMDTKAIDKNTLCLRYDMESFPGVPTTLVFHATNEKIVKGDCFDHLAILTHMDIDAVNQRIERSQYNIFMKPTEMFGTKVMGVLDPNGYKVVIATE